MNEATASSSEPTLPPGTPIQQLHGVGERRAALFARLGIGSVRDLLRHRPLRYEHEAAEGTIAELTQGTIGSARGTIAAARWVGGRGGSTKGRFEATLEDPTGTLLLTFFNAPYLQSRLHPGQALHVQGKVKQFGVYRQMVNPRWQALGQDDQPPTRDERVRPVYPATEDLPSPVIERIVEDALPRVLPTIRDPLPEPWRAHHEMPTLAEAYRMLHQPEHGEQPLAARRRLAYNELLLLQLGITMKRAFVREQLQAPALRYSEAIDQHIRARFPFELTQSQRQVIDRIAGDLTGTQPMNRLLQGDVGSGKTVVALYALLMAVADRRQGALMAPTELLAEQHYASISQMLEGANVRLGLLTAGQAPAGSAQRRETLGRIERGEIDILIGTQALLGEAVRFRDLAVAVVDEQHRFGVVQRAGFRSVNKEETEQSDSSGGCGPGEGSSDHASPRPGGERSASGPSGGEPGEGAAGQANAGNRDAPSANPPLSNSLPRGGREDASTPPSDETRPSARKQTAQRVPHYLVMTATPIPRTLSLTIFGDLDVSTIRGMPPGRSPIINRVVKPSDADRVYEYMRQRLARGEQAYIVVPTIEGGGEATSKPLKNVRDHASDLRRRLGESFVVEAIHSQLGQSERDDIMTRFREGSVHALVATTVIEVGVDVPHATMMVIEHAERFGLAQLHQLRGRIGRNAHGPQSLCVFIAEPVTAEASERMNAIGASTDGFRIAELDLQIRGMGEFFGTRQSGLPPLHFASLPDDLELLQLAQRDAQAMIVADPTLREPSHQTLRQLLLAQYGEALGLIDVG